MEPEERSHAGLFLSFQTPTEIPGVSNIDFLRMATNARRKAQGQPELDPLEFYGFVAPLVRAAGCGLRAAAIRQQLLEALPWLGHCYVLQAACCGSTTHIMPPSAPPVLHCHALPKHGQTGLALALL
jgi:hypothetical protein